MDLIEKLKYLSLGKDFNQLTQLYIVIQKGQIFLRVEWA
jgi:hypothetical protein